MSKRDWGVEDPEETYWYNTRTGQVEEGPQSLGIDRIGPFKTREEAANGPAKLQERAKEWAEEEAQEDS
ncbi:methionine aminopeptidase [Leucobacter tenebrionis]|uniref:methionine aminopeptidase n=1 Tax=Leucobacter tenebrionis TaxID=2873270 RepID=UPI001CA78111|nr:methionine aminopeptidase [Leucobacter tenebrionis]QZY52130.1 methionine aminopeptidase [Leucobacter tenebrionis]